jgi:hypothetical protein
MLGRCMWGVGKGQSPGTWPGPPQVRNELRLDEGEGRGHKLGMRKLGSTGYSKLATPSPLYFCSPFQPLCQQPQPLLHQNNPLAKAGSKAGCAKKNHKMLGHSRQTHPENRYGDPLKTGRRNPMASISPSLFPMSGGGSMTKGVCSHQCSVCLASILCRVTTSSPPLLLFSSKRAARRG